MEPELTRIAARSRRQAMDWSLVLVSQGIEPVVQRNADGAGWELLIPTNDSEKAFRTLRLYRTENRGWPWPQASSWPSQLFNWTSLVWGALLVLFHWLASNRPRVHAAGVDVTPTGRGTAARLERNDRVGADERKAARRQRRERTE